ncbi:SRPBCC domain-containing protein [Octadecabacter sp. G9-8]|uniref:SRPBCC domain-containing protein n=1 Tax=Octadecabacter dasysiphoniae TaxID=2909341 RepID=A0ABS9CV15_9RHOB|nr:SRPBCC domain-containing protein [Octadecabacter dasysiphoniae]MCF2870031.1 SRPBCC domain-containing protein [Octadecabacter dasysiphoniae]
MTHTLTKTIYLKAPRKDVWPYLTEPDKMALWFHKPTKTLEKGDTFAMHGTTSGDKLISGDVIEAYHCEHLEYTFTIPHMPDNVSTVRITLEDVFGGTRLTLVHEGLPLGEDAFDFVLALDKGWDGHFGQLRDAVHGTD